jgi:hypothetical protein
MTHSFSEGISKMETPESGTRHMTHSFSEEIPEEETAKLEV